MTMALERYTETRRDRIESDLLISASRPEIYYERRHGLDIRVYYLKKLGTILMSLVEGEGETLIRREFPVPNDRVNDAIAHPEFYYTMSNLANEFPLNEDDGA